MIELINASKFYPTRFGRHYIFKDVSLKLPGHLNIGIIGPNGAGKSTLMRLLAGVDYPSEGRIVRTGKISWPLGLVPSMLGPLTGRENARFVCRIYGLGAKEIERKLIEIAEVANIGNYFDMPVRTYSTGMRSRLNFATSMAIEFDYYLFDEISAPGDRFFRQTSRKMMEERLAKSRFILTSHNAQDILDLCDTAILLGDGKLRYFDDVRDALREYGEDQEVDLAQRRRGRRATKNVNANGADDGRAASASLPETNQDERPARRISRERPKPKLVKREKSHPISPKSNNPVPPPAPVPPAPAARGPEQPAIAAAKAKPPRRAVPLRQPAKKDGPRAQ